MKYLLLTVLIALSFLTHLTAQSTMLCNDVVGNIGVQNQPITQAVLQQWNPYTFTLDVPPDASDTLQGFDTGFAVLPSVPDRSVQLDSLKIKHCSYGVYHLDVTTGVETPVLYPNGAPMTNIKVQNFGSESVNGSGPVVFTTSLGEAATLYGELNSPTNSIILDTTVNNVGVIFVTKMSFSWGFVPDFTKPSKNQGYVVRFDIRVVPTYLGFEYPEEKVKIFNQNEVVFVYQVVDVPKPELVDLKLYTLDGQWGSLPNQNTESGVILQMSGSHLEYFKLQRSSDLITWNDFPFDGEGNGWSRPFTVPSQDGEGYWANTYHWTLFDRNFPDERRTPVQEFYRMVWTGKRSVWREWSPTQERP